MTPESAIQQAWLMWVGDCFYPTFEAFATEAEEQGISKRVVNPAVASALMQPGQVIFLAHKEGEQDECLDCLGEFPCPECGGSGKVLRGRGSKRKPVDCGRCGGSGTVHEGTGGSVILDGEQIPMKLFHGKKRHGLKPEEHDVRMPITCEQCNGTGRTPRAVVHGLFIPDGAEYILRPSDDEKVREEMAKRSITLVTAAMAADEKERGCGKRKPGGTYLVTRTEGDKPEVKDVIRELAAAGLLETDGVDVHGSFVRLLKPVRIAAKFFRGIKKWDVPAAAEGELEMVMEAIA